MSSSYIGCFGTERGVVVPEEQAFDYAKNHLDELSEEDKQEFVDWFFSGNFIKKEIENDFYRVFGNTSTR